MEAIYKTMPLQELSGNPLTEALHFLCTSDYCSTVLTENLEWCPNNFWELNKFFRMSVITKLKSIHVQAPQLETIYTKIVSLLLESYSHRNPFTADIVKTKHLNALALQKKCTFSPVKTTTASTVVVRGISGTGKTTALRSLFIKIPQVIVHQEYMGNSYKQHQLVWISIDLPVTPSIKALALNFFKAVDEALGCTDYYVQWSRRSRESVDQHLNAMRLVAQTHELGIVHIDEMQFMLNYLRSKDAPSMSLLEALFNKLGIPLILSTTNAGLQLFSPDYMPNGVPDITISRRMLNDREIELKMPKLNSDYFERFFNALFPKSILVNCNELGDSFRNHFYELSCGLPAIMMRLAYQYHEIFMQRIDKQGSANACTDDIKLLTATYNNQFKLIHPALAYLRSGKFEHYEKDLAKQGASVTEQPKPSAKRTTTTKAVAPNPMFPAKSVDLEIPQSPFELKAGVL